MGFILQRKAPRVRRIACFFAEGRKRRPYWVTLERGPKVSSLRCSQVDHLAVKDDSSPSRPRVYDMRCTSRSGWGKASILSDQGGGSSPCKKHEASP